MNCGTPLSSSGRNPASRGCAIFENGGWKNLIMIGIACVLIYLAVKKGFEPLLLLPIAFGMLLVNLPLSGIMDPQMNSLVPMTAEELAQKPIKAYSHKTIRISFICRTRPDKSSAHPGSILSRAV